MSKGQVVNKEPPIAYFARRDWLPTRRQISDNVEKVGVGIALMSIDLCLEFNPINRSEVRPVGSLRPVKPFARDAPALPDFNSSRYSADPLKLTR